MSKITHPSMRRVRDTSTSNQPAPQSYVVGDETDMGTEYARPPEEFVPPVPEEIKPESKLADAPAPQKTSVKKGMLEDLIFLGRATKSVDVSNHSFKMATLTHREHNDLMKELYKFGDGADLFTLRTLTLAFALKSIDDIPLEDIPLGDEEDKYNTGFSKKLGIIDSLQMNVVTKLFDAYNELVKDMDDNLKGEEVKNS